MKKSLITFSTAVLTVLVSASSCNKDIAVTEITVEPAEVSLVRGDEVQLTVNVTPENATYEIEVINSDNSIISIDESYKIVALEEGEAFITFKAGNKTAVCNITVSSPELGISPACDEIIFDAARPETCEFEVTGNIKDWIVECDAEWCVVYKTENGFTVTAEPTISREGNKGATISLKSDTYDVQPINIPTSQNGLKVYLAGNDNSYATYWYNGAPTRVSETQSSYLVDIYATKEDKVSVVGRAGIAKSIGLYWDKDMGEFYLNTREYSSGTAFDVFIDEETGDIYFTDHEGWTQEDYSQTYVARYWKNFVRTDLTEEGYVSQAGDIMYKGGNLYIMVQQGNEKYYLKNDEKIMLENYDGGIYPSSMFISGEDVYIGGYYLATDKYCPCYWKNGEITTIPTDQNAQVYGIAVDDDENVYLAGSYGSGLSRSAAYWKNGEMTELTEQNNSCLSDIVIVGDNIICGGTANNPERMSVATCWINGEVWEMSDKTTSCWVEAMFVR